MRKYTLSDLLPEQARAISNALEFYARIRTGQINEIISMFRRSIPASVKVPAENLDEAEGLLRQVKRLLFPDLSPDASYGIRSAPDEASKTCYDIHQVIRHRLAWDEDPVSPEGFPEGFRTVHHDEPWACGKLPLPKIEKTENSSSEDAGEVQKIEEVFEQYQSQKKAGY